MSKDAVTDWDATAGNNTDAGGVNIAEGCAPSTINNAIREVMSQVASLLAQDTIASAATTDLGSKEAQYLVISGTTTITAFGTIKAGTLKFVEFSGALTLTHNGTTLILPNGVNIVTVAGDTAVFISEGSGNWRCLGGTITQVKNIAACQGRLTLETGVPVSTSDQTAKTTLYFTPHMGNQIWLYSGSIWVPFSFSELSLSLSSYTTGKPFDIFAYDNSGTVTLESLVWTNDTTRATALTTQDGIYVKSGATTRRYLGTIYTSATGQTQLKLGSLAAGGGEAWIGLWNMYNRVPLRCMIRDSADSSAQGNGTWTAMLNSTGNRVSAIRGLDESGVNVIASQTAIPAAGGTGFFNIALDGTTPTGLASIQFDTGFISPAVAHWGGLPGLGFHYLQPVTKNAGNTVTWYGDNGAGTDDYQAGIIAEMEY